MSIYQGSHYRVKTVGGSSPRSDHDKEEGKWAGWGAHEEKIVHFLDRPNQITTNIYSNRNSSSHSSGDHKSELKVLVGRATFPPRDPGKNPSLTLPVPDGISWLVTAFAPVSASIYTGPSPLLSVSLLFVNAPHWAHSDNAGSSYLKILNCISKGTISK